MLNVAEAEASLKVSWRRLLMVSFRFGTFATAFFHVPDFGGNWGRLPPKKFMADGFQRRLFFQANIVSVLAKLTMGELKGTKF